MGSRRSVPQDQRRHLLSLAGGRSERGGPRYSRSTETRSVCRHPLLSQVVRIYGPGTSPISWVSYRDFAEMCAIALLNPAARRRGVELGGPVALTPLDVVARFKKG